MSRTNHADIRKKTTLNSGNLEFSSKSGTTQEADD